MSVDGWIFVVGFRIFDVGLLVLWLVWFLRMRNDDADSNEDGGDDHGGGPPVHPPDPSGGGGIGLFAPGTVQAPRRRRGHAPAPRPAHRRPVPVPSRVTAEVAKTKRGRRLAPVCSH